ALVMTLPLLAGRVVPVRVRIALIAALAVVILPATKTVALPTNALSLGMGLVHEALIGAMMGLSLTLMLTAAQLAGSIVENLCGFSLASFGVGGDGDSGGGVFARLFWWTAVAVFVASGGLNQVVGSVMQSFVTLPPGAASADRSLLEFLVQALSQSFEFGLMAALPAVAALLVASAVLGMAQKNFPQLGGMHVGLGLKAVCGMLAASLVLISLPWMIRGGFDLSILQIEELVQQLAAGLQDWSQNG
ncbi:MAG: flagellar biosynthetic protein FliR, partial [Pirellulaceae bacterium]